MEEEGRTMMDVMEVGDEDEDEEGRGGRKEGLLSLSISRRAVFLGSGSDAVLLLPESAWWDEEEGGRRRTVQEVVERLLLTHTAAGAAAAVGEGMGGGGGGGGGGGEGGQAKEGWVEGWADVVALDQEEEEWEGAGGEMALSVRLEQ